MSTPAASFRPDPATLAALLTDLADTELSLRQLAERHHTDIVQLDAFLTRCDQLTESHLAATLRIRSAALAQLHLVVASLTAFLQPRAADPSESPARAAERDRNTLRAANLLIRLATLGQRPAPSRKPRTPKPTPTPDLPTITVIDPDRTDQPSAQPPAHSPGAIMNKRQLGKHGPLVGEIGLGCMGMSDFYDPKAQDEAESIRVMHRSIEAGGNFFDTADMYGVGRNETLIAKAIKDRRDRVFIATKFANVRSPSGEFLGVRGDAPYVKQACDASLQRLGVDTIDLYYQHRVDPNTPIEETVGAMAELVKAGKVRYLGLSEAAPATIRRAAKVHPIAALQTEYSLWSREPEGEILATTRELGIAFVAYSPLGRGFLTGQYKTIDDLPPDDWRRHMPRFQGENFQKNLDIVTRLQEIAREKGCTPSQLAIAWTLAQGPDIIPIPGTKRLKYLEDNLGAANVKLTPADLSRIDAAFPLNAAAGTRYTERGMNAVNR